VILQQRIQWACRRGMLELDLILMDFLTSCYPSLDLENQKIFEQLLSSTDAELADWLLTEKSPDEKFQKIIKIIKNHANSYI
jgi:antitoxin CptB